MFCGPALQLTASTHRIVVVATNEKTFFIRGWGQRENHCGFIVVRSLVCAQGKPARFFVVPDDMNARPGFFPVLLALALTGCGGGGDETTVPPRTATVSIAFPRTELTAAAPVVTLPGFSRSLGTLRKVDVRIAVTIESEVMASATGGASLSGDYSIRGFCSLQRTPGGLNLVETPTSAGGTSGTLSLGPGGSQTWTFTGADAIVTQQTTTHTRGSAFDAFNGSGEIAMKVLPKVVAQLPPGATSTVSGNAEGTVSVTYTYTPALP
jgi:hypothetical protein